MDTDADAAAEEIVELWAYFAINCQSDPTLMLTL